MKYEYMNLKQAMQAVMAGAEYCVAEANRLGPRTENGQLAWWTGDQLLVLYRLLKKQCKETDDETVVGI